MTILLLILLCMTTQLFSGFQRPMMGYQQPFTQHISDDEPDSGNWYEKLRWWKEAKRVYSEDVHDAMEQVRSITASHEEKKKGLYSQLEVYYGSLPVARLAAAGIINGLLEELKKEADALQQIKESQQKKEEREKAALLEGQTKKLEALKDDFEQFNTMVSRLHEAYDDVFTQQIRDCDTYDERALESFERIEKVLDDEKAHHYYDLVENSLENIRAITQYLRGPFAMFIDQAWAKIQEIMPKLQTSIAELDKQGIPVRVLTEQEKAEREAFKKKQEESRLKAEADRKAEAERQAMPWWKKIFYSIGSFFASIGRAVQRAVYWIGGIFSRTPVKPALPGKLGNSTKVIQTSNGPADSKVPNAPGEIQKGESAQKGSGISESRSSETKPKAPSMALPLDIQKSLRVS